MRSSQLTARKGDKREERGQRTQGRRAAMGCEKVELTDREARVAPKHGNLEN